MKCGLSFFVSTVAAAGTKNMDFSGFKTDSISGKKLLSRARRLEDNFDETYVASTSIVFQGCHNTTSWSEEGFQTMSLVRFLLCPTSYCSKGCKTNSYGEYLVDMNMFVDAYMESMLDQTRYKCETMREGCGCDEDNNACLYYCYKNYGDDSIDWTFCQQQQGEEERLGECKRFEVKNGNRRLANQNENNYEIFMGPYCGPGGNGIFLTLFTDEDCTMEMKGAASYYSSLAGTSMPYQYSGGSTGMVGTDCISCTKPKEQQDDDWEDKDEINRVCEETYNGAAKCETYLYDKYSRDESGCSYIAAMKSSSGSSAYSATSVSTTTVSFMAIVSAFVLLAGAAVFIIRKKRRLPSSKTAPLVETELTPPQK